MLVNGALARFGSFAKFWLWVCSCDFVNVPNVGRQRNLKKMRSEGFFFLVIFPFFYFTSHISIFLSIRIIFGLSCMKHNDGAKRSSYSRVIDFELAQKINNPENRYQIEFSKSYVPLIIILMLLGKMPCGNKHFQVCTEPKRCILFLIYSFLKAKSTIWRYS